MVGGNKFGTVEEGALQEVVLFGLLHLDDEIGSVLVGAEDVDDGLPGFLSFGDELGVEEGDIDDVMAVDEGVEQADGCVLELFGAEDALEGCVDGGVGEDRGDDVVILSHSSNDLLLQSSG